MPPAPPPAPPTDDAIAPNGGRSVAHTVTLELGASDVAATHQRLAIVANAAFGEFVESASLQGSGTAARSHVRLRVAADRLDAVLARLRDLGTVHAEEHQGQDVTEQIVDVDARLRNERAVEVELRELLAARADAPLEDVLALRRELQAVRATIERLEGRRAQTLQLVRLATVLVLVTAEVPDEPDDDGNDDAGFFDLLGQAVGPAWDAGMESLIASIATILRILVGGLLWWIAIGAAAIVVLRGRSVRPADDGPTAPPRDADHRSAIVAPD